jgi:sulfate adenylyltransferase
MSLNPSPPLPDTRDDLRRAAHDLPSLQLSAGQAAELELLAAGVPWRLSFAVETPTALRNGRYELLGILSPDSGVSHLSLPPHPDFPDLRPPADEVRQRLAALGRRRVLALAPDRPLWRADEELLELLADEFDAGLLLLPTCGPSPWEFYARLRAIRLASERWLPPNVVWLLPEVELDAAGLAAVALALGATHLLSAEPVTAPGLTVIAWPPPAPEPPRPEIAALLEAAHPPLARGGLCLWFTGLPSSGKSTLADAVTAQLRQAGRTVTLLDGDLVRTHLSKGLGFSREDRDANILRIGFVAAEIVRHRGTAVCAAVSPYRAARDQARAMVGAARFVEIHVATPLEVCEQRDVKGLYAKARAGQIRGFTGVDDPYEPPAAAELTIDAACCSVLGGAAQILDWLKARGFLEGARA